MPPVGRPRSRATLTVWRTRVPPPTPMTSLCFERNDPSSATSGRSADLPRSKIDWPPIETSATSGMISNSRSLWVLAITRLSTSDSRINDDAMCVRPSPVTSLLMGPLDGWRGFSVVRDPLAETPDGFDEMVADVSAQGAERGVHREPGEKDGVGDRRRLHGE